MIVEWSLALVQPVTETLLCNVPSATHRSHTRRLNGIDDAIFAVSLNDPGIIAVALDQDDIVLKVEGMVRRNGTVVLVGPVLIVDIDMDAGIAEVQVVSWWWYFHRRCFGRADRITWIANGGFETSAVALTGWSTFGTVTASVEHIDVTEGDHAAELVATANNQGGISQVPDLTAILPHNYPPGLGLYVNAQVHVDSAATVDTGTILVEIEASDGTNSYFGRAKWNASTIGQTGYNRAAAGVLLGPDVNWTVTVRLYAVNGTVRYDSVQVFFQDSTNAGDYPGGDYADLFTNIVTYAQTPSLGWSNLGVSISAPATGVTILAGYDHFLHENIGDTIVALTEVDGTFDFSADHATRTARMHYPRRGGTKADWRLGLDRQLTRGGRIRVDGSQVETAHIVLGDPFWSEEGGAVDTSDFGGLTLVGTSRAPVSTPLRHLDRIAQERVDQHARLMTSVAVDVSTLAGDFAGNVEPGDTIGATVREGWVAVDADYRIVNITEEGPVVRCDLAAVLSGGS